MPKLYKDGETPPYKTKEYYRQKMREYRSRNATKKVKTSNKQVCWSITLNNKKYIFKSKSDIVIDKITKDSIDKSNDIICF